ncbi:hypothetical protein C8R47DRAFT_1073558 [Mycena vitilis]|nr:hypothetical protein C8R47DRAFT_1073558 [Mycena vitilis]
MGNRTTASKNLKRHGPAGDFIGEQEQMLRAFLSTYVDASKSGKTRGIWTALFKDYWAAFPWRLPLKQDPNSEDATDFPTRLHAGVTADTAAMLDFSRADEKVYADVIRKFSHFVWGAHEYRKRGSGSAEMAENRADGADARGTGAQAAAAPIPSAPVPVLPAVPANAVPLVGVSDSFDDNDILAHLGPPVHLDDMQSFNDSSSDFDGLRTFNGSSSNYSDLRTNQNSDGEFDFTDDLIRATIEGSMAWPSLAPPVDPYGTGLAVPLCAELRMRLEAMGEDIRAAKTLELQLLGADDLERHNNAARNFYMIAGLGLGDQDKETLWGGTTAAPKTKKKRKAKKQAAKSNGWAKKARRTGVEEDKDKDEGGSNSGSESESDKEQEVETASVTRELLMTYLAPEIKNTDEFSRTWWGWWTDINPDARGKNRPLLRMDIVDWQVTLGWILFLHPSFWPTQQRRNRATPAQAGIPGQKRSLADGPTDVPPKPSLSTSSSEAGPVGTSQTDAATKSVDNGLAERARAAGLSEEEQWEIENDVDADADDEGKGAARMGCRTPGRTATVRKKNKGKDAEGHQKWPNSSARAVWGCPYDSQNQLIVVHVARRHALSEIAIHYGVLAPAGKAMEAGHRVTNASADAWQTSDKKDRAADPSCEVIERDTGSVQEFVDGIWRAEDSLFIATADDSNPSTSVEIRTPEFISEPPSPLSPSFDVSDTISVLPTTPGHEDEQSANYLTHSDNGIPLASFPSGLPLNAEHLARDLSRPHRPHLHQLEFDNLADSSLSHAVESDLTESATTQSRMFGGETPNSDGGSVPLTFALGPDAMNVDEPKGSLPQRDKLLAINGDGLGKLTDTLVTFYTSQIPGATLTLI